MEKGEKTDEFSCSDNAWKLVARFKLVHCAGEHGRLARERAQKFSIGGVKKHPHLNLFSFSLGFQPPCY